jgi:hypothetical protein
MKLQDIKDVQTVNETMSQHTDVNSEVARLVDHWKEHGKGMSDDQLADAIGNDLEQLEYSPQEVSSLVSKIVAKVKGG